jgi:calcineurin-like phosphoesterase family protein
MYISPESGRNDHIHGDEHYYDYLSAVKDQTVDDVVTIIADNGSGAYDWIKLLADTDALYHLVVIVSKGRNKPEYKELLEALKTEIEGFV